MMERWQLWGAIGGAGVLGFAWYIGIGGDKIKWIVGVSAIIGILYWAAKNNVFDPMKDSIERQRDKTLLERAIDEPEAREAVKQWSKEAYHGRSSIDIRFSRGKTDTTRLNWPDDDPELLRYYYTIFGEDNTGVLVFVECVSGRVTGHKPVDWEEARERPFEYSDYYQQYLKTIKLHAWQNAPARRRRSDDEVDPMKAEDENNEG